VQNWLGIACWAVAVAEYVGGVIRYGFVVRLQKGSWITSLEGLGGFALDSTLLANKKQFGSSETLSHGGATRVYCDRSRSRLTMKLSSTCHCASRSGIVPEKAPVN
jgi:hypothetical protein